jgi:cytochrome c551/c552
MELEFGRVVACHHTQIAAVLVGREEIEIAGMQADQHRRIVHLARRIAQGDLLARGPVLVPPGMTGGGKQGKQQGNRYSKDTHGVSTGIRQAPDYAERQ